MGPAGSAEARDSWKAQNIPFLGGSRGFELLQGATGKCLIPPCLPRRERALGGQLMSSGPEGQVSPGPEVPLDLSLSPPHCSRVHLQQE